ncbi:MAG: cell division protein FtsA [Lachnospiraceae bacterium]|nr:cell division protein FtsA [Lachnospiraceae bacterium]
MQKVNKGAGSYVYGLDIGTRSIVGTVGYRQKDRFVVVAQQVREHESRAMLDGQIHDIAAVSDTIREVTDSLEEKTGESLTQVCIAAAGRVLKTVTVHVDMDLEGEKTLSKEDIHMLDSYGIEKAYELFQNEEESDMKFYCVGYSVVHYYMNGYPMNNLENHKAKEISADMIATFLPDDVVDGLYKAVEMAGLEVANLTLEPIAAIELAIPEMYRMLNIALIDVGAGTSDISITKDGSIIAYGMLPVAGDCLTETIARHCLVDFQTAERIKRGIEKEEAVEYKDIMGLPQKISREEVLSVVENNLEDMAQKAADKIKELNGDKPVSAVFVVGGGGKIATYTERVAKHLDIAKERCAVRGEEVMMQVDFLEKSAIKDSLMVTPIGICLNYYEQSNNFIFVTFNDKRVKLYDNNRLAIVDAAIMADFPNEDLFPKRGESLEFMLNGKPMTIRGDQGESAAVMLNGKEADIHTPVRSNDVIKVIPSTAGEKATLEVSKLPDYEGSLTIHFDGKKIRVPKLTSVNGQMQSAYYQIQNGDEVELLNYYTVLQVLEFMDISTEEIDKVWVNREEVDMTARIYDNFTISVSRKEWEPAAETEAEEDTLSEAENMQESRIVSGDSLSAADSTGEQDDTAEKDSQENVDSESVESYLTKAKADAEKVVTQLQYERAEEALSQMILNAMAGGVQSQAAPLKAPGGQKSQQAEELRIEKSSRELYSSIQNNINRLKSGTSVTELREEALEKEPETQPQSSVPPARTEDVDGKSLQIIHVIVNEELVTLKGKPDYVYVDVFDFIDFDLSKPQGKTVETLINGRKAQYTELLSNGDRLEIFWKD